MKFSKKSLYYFGWELAKRLAMPNVLNRYFNELKSRVQWEIKRFLGTALETEELQTKVKQ